LFVALQDPDRAADGWDKWKKHPDDPKLKQPYLIKLKTDEPCFFAVLGHFQRSCAVEPRDGDGFVVLTAGSGAA